MLCDVGNCAMMLPVTMLRPVRIHHVFPISTHILSSLCVACTRLVLLYRIYTLIDILPMQVDWGGGTWTSLFNSKCKHCIAIEFHSSIRNFS
jgi:hypothetical protein